MAIWNNRNIQSDGVCSAVNVPSLVWKYLNHCYHIVTDLHKSGQFIRDKFRSTSKAYRDLQREALPPEVASKDAEWKLWGSRFLQTPTHSRLSGQIGKIQLLLKQCWEAHYSLATAIEERFVSLVTSLHVVFFHFRTTWSLPPAFEPSHGITLYCTNNPLWRLKMTQVQGWSSSQLLSKVPPDPRRRLDGLTEGDVMDDVYVTEYHTCITTIKKPGFVVASEQEEPLCPPTSTSVCICVARRRSFLSVLIVWMFHAQHIEFKFPQNSKT